MTNAADLGVETLYLFMFACLGNRPTNTFGENTACRTQRWRGPASTSYLPLTAVTKRRACQPRVGFERLAECLWDADVNCISHHMRGFFKYLRHTTISTAVHGGGLPQGADDPDKQTLFTRSRAATVMPPVPPRILHSQVS